MTAPAGLGRRDPACASRSRSSSTTKPTCSTAGSWRPGSELFVEDCTYSCRPTDLPDADPHRHTFLVHDDRFLLEQRVRSLLTKTAHAEWPHSRTRRLVTNVRARSTTASSRRPPRSPSTGCATTSWTATSARTATHLRDGAGGELLFKDRVAVLDLESLRPQAKVTIII